VNFSLLTNASEGVNFIFSSFSSWFGGETDLSAQPVMTLWGAGSGENAASSSGSSSQKPRKRKKKKRAKSSSSSSAEAQLQVVDLVNLPPGQYLFPDIAEDVETKENRGSRTVTTSRDLPTPTSSSELVSLSLDEFCADAAPLPLAPAGAAVVEMKTTFLLSQDEPAASSQSQQDPAASMCMPMPAIKTTSFLLSQDEPAASSQSQQDMPAMPAMMPAFAMPLPMPLPPPMNAAQATMPAMMPAFAMPAMMPAFAMPAMMPAFAMPLPPMPLPPPMNAAQATIKAAASAGPKLKALHWEGLEDGNVEGTVWAGDAGDGVLGDAGELFGLFGKKKTVKTPRRGKSKSTGKTPRSKRGKTPKSKRGKGGASLDLIRGGRMQIVAIGLARFKSAGGARAVGEAIALLNHATLSSEQLGALKQLMPEADELKRARALIQSNAFGLMPKHTLGEPDRFVLSMGALKEPHARCNALIFRAHWQALAHDLITRISQLKRACDAIRTSRELIGVMKTILSVGNLLNANTRRGGAQGFTIQSLSKLGSVKAADGSTLVDYVGA